MLTVNLVLAELRKKSNPRALKGMSRFGISSANTLGVPVPYLRDMAKRLGKNHKLAKDLWASGIHEARILASMVDKPSMVTEAQMDRWTDDFDSWDVCDQCCGNLFDKTPYAFSKALEWSGRKEEFVRRAGFVMMAELAVHEKTAPDSEFVRFFRPIEEGSTDDRNFVKKSVNWALRQIGKRNQSLNVEAVKVAERIRRLDSSSARWIASDAIRELSSEEVQRRLFISSSFSGR